MVRVDTGKPRRPIPSVIEDVTSILPTSGNGDVAARRQPRYHFVCASMKLTRMAGMNIGLHTMERNVGGSGDES